MNKQILKKIAFSLIVVVVGVAALILFLPGGQAGASINYWAQFDFLTDHHHDPPNPVLNINHSMGQQGSYFLFTLNNYPPYNNTYVKLNGLEIGNVHLDDQGNGQFELDTSFLPNGTYFMKVIAAVDDGPAVVVAEPPSATTVFILSTDAPLHPTTGASNLITAPDSVPSAITNFLPILTTE